MDKKSVVLFVSSLIMLGIVFAAGDLGSFTISVPSGDGFEVASWTTNFPATLNLTIAAASGANLTNVTVVLDSANYSWNLVALNGSAAGLDDGNFTMDSVYDVVGANLTGWECRNASANIFSCNGSVNPIDGSNPSNSSIIILLNVTGAAGVEDVNINFTAYACGGDECDAESNGLANTSTLFFNNDDLTPRLIEINVTDGNTTMVNGSEKNATTFDGTGTITVAGTLVDTTLETNAYLYCSTNITASRPSLLNGNVATITGLSNGTGTTYFSVALPSICVADGNTTSFLLFVNDSFNQNIEFNETTVPDVDIPFTITFNNTINPTIGIVNVTQSFVDSDGNTRTVTRTSGTNLNGGFYIGARNSTFTVEVSGYEMDEVVIVFNNNSRTLPYWFNTEFDPQFVNATIMMVNLTAGYNETNPGYGTSVLEQSINLASYADNASFEFYITVNNTDDNYTAVAGPYRFEIDDAAPAEPTMTAPADRTINPRGSITYSCESSDAEAGTIKIKWKLSKPDSTTVTKVFDDVTTNKQSVTFTGDDTSAVGTYTVYCTSLDAVGKEITHTSTTGENFQVLSSAVTYAGGGEEGGEAGPSFDVDFSASDSATLRVPEGTIKTFTFDGKTEHSITFKEVTETTATLEIASTPITLTLVIGETKNVDINADGTNDLAVKLNSISNGKADVTISKLKEGADKVVQQETGTQQPPAQEQPPAGQEGVPQEQVEEQGGSTAWIWITLIVVVAVVIVGYLLLKKKKQ